MHSRLAFAVPCQAEAPRRARAFDRGKLLFSEKLTAMTVNAYLAVQRVYCPRGFRVTALYISLYSTPTRAVHRFKAVQLTPRPALAEGGTRGAGAGVI